MQALVSAVLTDPGKTLLIAGDVTKAGTARGYLGAGDFVEGLISQGATVLIVPGNHDLRTTWKHNGKSQEWNTFESCFSRIYAIVQQYQIQVPVYA
jgi:3',5'-cyclic AMP phosphodiesterase CpdA